MPIPGFPGERIDRRLLRDIRWLRKRFPLFVTDGYSMDPVHAANGEHPLGLALDIVSNPKAGGSWNDIDALAAWAEPRRNRPRQPFRWVGYDGDAGHGRRNHLHLSWSHSDITRPGRPARSVYTVRCPAPLPPGPVEPAPEPPAPTSPEPPTGGGGNGGGGGTGGGVGPASGGIGSKPRLAPPVIERDGVNFAER